MAVILLNNVINPLVSAGVLTRMATSLREQESVEDLLALLSVSVILIVSVFTLLTLLSFVLRI